MRRTTTVAHLVSPSFATIAQVCTVDKVHPMFTELVKRNAATRSDIVA